MLIVSNGAFKSGSTWVTLIVRQLREFTKVPREFCDERWMKDSIPPSLVPGFVAGVDLDAADYLIKAHYKPSDGVREAFLGHPTVRILNVYRDPKDVVVSAYFHYCRFEGFTGTFPEFFEQRAERLVRSLAEYHLYWDPAGCEDRIFLTTYEKLHRSFADEVYRLGAFLDCPLTEGQIEAIRESTAFSKLQFRGNKKQPSRFFRKGTMGDWLEHMTPEQGAFVDRIEAEEGIALVQDPILY